MLITVFIQLLLALAVSSRSSSNTSSISSSTTTSPRFCGPYGSVASTLTDNSLVTFQFEPIPSQSNFTFISWDDYKDATQLTVLLTICDYLSVKGLSFDTSNVNDYNVLVDDRPHYVVMDQSGKVEISLDHDTDLFKVGWRIKINVTAKEYSLPVEIRNLKIKTCNTYFDCFDSCAIYVLQPNTGCKMPMCRGDPCAKLGCSGNQECRLITGEPLHSFPSVMTSGVQLWGCVDKDRTDYGCSCKYYIGENDCPTCQCLENP